MIPPQLQRPEVARSLRLAALSRYEDLGFASTTADDIAGAAGVSRRSLFHYFPTIVDILFSDHHLIYLPAFTQALQQRSGDAISTASRALSAVFNGFENDWEFVCRRQALIRDTAALRDRERLWFGLYHAQIRSLLQHGSTNPQETIPAAMAAGALMSAFMEVIDQWLRGHLDTDPLTAFDYCVKLVARDFSRPLDITSAAPSRVVVIDTDLSADEIRQLITSPTL